MLAVGGAAASSSFRSGLCLGLGRVVLFARTTAATTTTTTTTPTLISSAPRPICILGRRRRRRPVLGRRRTTNAVAHHHHFPLSTLAFERRGGGGGDGDSPAASSHDGVDVNTNADEHAAGEGRGSGTAGAASATGTSTSARAGGRKKKIVTVVALSGGVDSSVALYLLHEKQRRLQRQQRRQQQQQQQQLEKQDEEQGQVVTHEVRGLFMNNWDPSQNENDCSDSDDEFDDSSGADGSSSSPSSSSLYCERTERDLRDAREVCDSLGVPLHLADFSAQYWTDVFEPYVDAIVSSSTSTNGGSSSGSGAMGGDDGGRVSSSSSWSRGGGGVMPNPDVECNRVVKFGAMRRYVEERFGGGDGEARIATGHYARLCHRPPLLPDGAPRAAAVTSMIHHVDDEDERARNDALLEEILSRHGGDDEEGGRGRGVGWIRDWGLMDHRDSDNRDQEHSRPPQPLLVAGADPRKDQSYFLSMVPGDAFRNVVFPLGHLHKDTPRRPRVVDEDDDVEKKRGVEYECCEAESSSMSSSVREIAREANLITATKRESMGICFVGNNNKNKNKNGRRGDFGDFVGGFVPMGCTPPGRFVCVDTGEIVGKHDGRGALLTVGQGARIGGASRKWFVVGKRVHVVNDGGVIVGGGTTTCTVSVCGGTHHPALYVDELHVTASEFNWIGGGGGGGGGAPPPPLLDGGVIHACCRIRHLQPLVPCTVEWIEEEEETDLCEDGLYNYNKLLLLRIVFDRPVRGVTPGQIAALYVAGGLVCLGGGPILRGGPTYHERGLELPSVTMLHPSGHNDLSVPSSAQETKSGWS